MTAAFAYVGLLSTFLLGATDEKGSRPLLIAYHNGLLTLRCDEKPLGDVLEKIAAATGIELVVEESVRSTLVSTKFVGLPLNRAIERVLEGSGVNHVGILDGGDVGVVKKLYVGSPATEMKGFGIVVESEEHSSLDDEDPLQPPDPLEALDALGTPEAEQIRREMETLLELVESNEMVNPFENVQTMQEEVTPPDQSVEDDSAPQPRRPAPGFTFPPPSFTRSPFTPGLETGLGLPSPGESAEGSGGPNEILDVPPEPPETTPKKKPTQKKQSR